MGEILFFIAGIVVGIIFVAWIACTADDRAVRLGTWVHNGVAYQLKRVGENYNG